MIHRLKIEEPVADAIHDGRKRFEVRKNDRGFERTVTQRAVKQLRECARYIDLHAEQIIGNIDQPNYITGDGIRLSFTLLENDAIPTLKVEKMHIVLGAIEIGGGE